MLLLKQTTFHFLYLEGASLYLYRLGKRHFLHEACMMASYRWKSFLWTAFIRNVSHIYTCIIFTLGHMFFNASTFVTYFQFLAIDNRTLLYWGVLQFCWRLLWSYKKGEHSVVPWHPMHLLSFPVWLQPKTKVGSINVKWR